MSFLETLATILHGGAPTWTCTACGGPVPGDDCGAVCPACDRVWCLACGPGAPDVCECS